MKAGERRAEAGRIPLERRGEVLDEVDLIDVAARDRLLDRLHRLRIVLVAPGALPFTDPVGADRAQGLTERTDATCGEREFAGLWGDGCCRPANRLREPVPEVQVRDAPARAVEPFLAKVALDRRE